MSVIIEKYNILTVSSRLKCIEYNCYTKELYKFESFSRSNEISSRVYYKIMKYSPTVRVILFSRAYSDILYYISMMFMALFH